ncbi:MAG: alpha/beta hydrolase family protein, partial [Acidimicrobiales bacterium]
PPAPRAVRFADPTPTPDHRWLICVRERHGEEVVNDLVAVPLDSDGEPVVLAGGHDFFASPAVSPDGTRLAWLAWDHPEMPWDATRLWVADLGPDARVADVTVAAGRDGESVQQPRWSPDGALHWISDRTGWWNLYREGVAICPMEAEFGVPAWVFGRRTYTFLANGTLVAAWHGPRGSGVGVVGGGTAHPIETPYTSFEYLAAAADDQVAAVASSPHDPPAVVRVGLDGAVEVLRRSRQVDLPDGAVSVPQRVAFPTAGGETAWALVYRPASAGFSGPDDERPPLVVMTHGGPTSQAGGGLDLSVQYWTTRGFAVADVDYRGSTGYGTAYRNRLRDSWGVCDVEDVVAVTRHLASSGVVDPDRCVIRGGSAGGYTTLAALAFTDAFAAGASYFGVADLGALARDTHKFESRYLDRLVGRWPEDEETFRARSPIFHVDGFDRPLLILQGLEDMVVPPAQAEMIYAALKEKGVPVAYLAFAGEQHGFRRAETIVAAAGAEVSFYGLVLGFTPDGAVEVPVENL